MILITLGTQDKGFSRLLESVDKAIEKGDIKEPVVVQAGYTKYVSKNMEILDFVDVYAFEKLIESCDILITHGGIGSILTGIDKHKKVIAAARLKQFGEHTNDHQKQIVNKFAEEGYIVQLENFDHIKEAIKKARKMKPKEYVSNTDHMIHIIENYIENH